jgi:HYR domain
MARKTLALALLAMLIALVGGTGRAQAAGGTYSITAGGNPIVGWTPDSGAIDQTSSEPIEATDTLVGLPIHGTDGTADFHIASGPGIVRAKIDGSFSIPSNLAYPFTPTMQAVSTTELTVSGPDGFVNTSLNLHVDGIIRSPVCGGRDECGGESVYISVGPFTRQAEFNTFGDTRANSLGLAFDSVPGGYRVHGDVTSAPLGVRTNTPYPVTILLNLSGGYSGTSTPTTIGGDFDDPAGLSQVSFSPSGPLLNDIPAGYTVSGPNVVNNRWTDPFASTGPADTAPPTVVGAPDRQPNIFGWYSSPVTVDWQSTDNSGQATDPADTVANQDGKDVVYTSGQSCDPSGNCATGTFTVSLDRVPPTVTCRPAPEFELADHSLAFVFADVSDTLSGSSGEANAGADISSAGHKTLQITGEDFAGNLTTVTCPYLVVANSQDTTPPVVTVPGDLTVDATGPGGARVTFTASAHDAVDPAPSLTCTPASGSAFPIGSTTVTCTAKDAAGNTASATFHVQVRGTGEQIARLVDKTRADVDVPLLRPVLAAPLQAAAALLAAGRTGLACVALNGYVLAVQLAPSAALTQAEKADLVADARRIRAVVGC